MHEGISIVFGFSQDTTWNNWTRNKQIYIFFVNLIVFIFLKNYLIILWKIDTKKLKVKLL